MGYFWVRPVSRDNNFNDNNRRNVNANNRANNRYGMTLSCFQPTLRQCANMKTYNNLYTELCSMQNLESAFKKARKRKTLKSYVLKFEENLKQNLNSINADLEKQTYKPDELTTFIVRDPKTRRINASSFRDRIVHHAICNIISPILEKRFIYDSFANQKKKGTHKAILRYEKFLRKVEFKQNRQQKLFQKTHSAFVFKADIRHYFEEVNHQILLNIIQNKITDKKVLWLISTILSSFDSQTKGKGMPIGNLTSQFFANVYLNELDLFIKHKLKVKCYIRYVDDFVILNRHKKELEDQREQINNFLRENLRLSIHTDKSKIINIQKGVTFLGFRIFNKYRLLKKSNQRRVWRRFKVIKELRRQNKIDAEKLMQRVDGWFAYAKFANTYLLRKKVMEFLTN